MKEFSYIYLGSLTTKQKKEIVDKTIRTKLGFELIKSAMVGSEYYGAVKESEDRVICVTADVNVHRGHLFVDVFTEYENPSNYFCPVSLFRMLTALPLKPEFDGARSWRSRCMTYFQQLEVLKKIKGYPVGTVLEATNKAGNTEVVTCVDKGDSRKGYVVKNTYAPYPLTVRNFEKVRLLSMGTPV